MTSSNDTSPHNTPEAQTLSSFTSVLKEGHQRFLAHAIEHSFACGRRSPQDFIRHFPPRAIMKGLEHQPSLRASILVLTTGIKQKIALKKEWEDAATDLQIALDEGETDAESIVALFDADDRVRYLDPQKVWVFLTEGEFWKTSASNKSLADLARTHIAFLLERALDDKLITHRDVIEGTTVDELANRLPKAELGRLIQCALQNADKGTSFTETDLLATTPPRTLVQHVPLAHLWDTVIVPRIADRHGYASLSRAVPDAPREPLKIAVAPEPVKAAQETPTPAVVKDAALPKAATPTAAIRDGAPPKDASKVKLKQPDPIAKSAPVDAFAPSMANVEGPTLVKGPALPVTPFGDESDDIEVMEDEVQAV